MFSGMQMKPVANNPLARKLVIVTLIKLAGLFILWWAFFSGPGTEQPTLDQVGEAILHPLRSNMNQP